MNMSPLIAAPVIVQLHVMATLASMALAILQLGSMMIAKGPAFEERPEFEKTGFDKPGFSQGNSNSGLRHRIFGWAFVVTMAMAALSSFWIVSLRHGQFSWIHLLSILTLVSLPFAIIARRRGNIRRHKWTMIGISTGLIVAGLFTLLPGRIMHNAVFG